MGKKDKNKKGVVYSTDPDFEYQYEAQEEQDTLPPGEQRLKVVIDRKQRKGKVVTLVEGFVGTAEDLKELEKTLKTKCGTGGSSKDGVILIQGEVKEKVVGILNELGYRAK